MVLSGKRCCVVQLARARALVTKTQKRVRRAARREGGRRDAARARARAFRATSASLGRRRRLGRPPERRGRRGLGLVRRGGPGGRVDVVVALVEERKLRPHRPTSALAVRSRRRRGGRVGRRLVAPRRRCSEAPRGRRGGPAAARGPCAATPTRKNSGAAARPSGPPPTRASRRPAVKRAGRRVGAANCASSSARISVSFSRVTVSRRRRHERVGARPALSAPSGSVGGDAVAFASTASDARPAAGAPRAGASASAARPAPATGSAGRGDDDAPRSRAAAGPRGRLHVLVVDRCVHTARSWPASARSAARGSPRTREAAPWRRDVPGSDVPERGSDARARDGSDGVARVERGGARARAPRRARRRGLSLVLERVAPLDRQAPLQRRQQQRNRASSSSRSARATSSASMLMTLSARGAAEEARVAAATLGTGGARAAAAMSGARSAAAASAAAAGGGGAAAASGARLLVEERVGEVAVGRRVRPRASPWSRQAASAAGAPLAAPCSRRRASRASERGGGATEARGELGDHRAHRWPAARARAAACARRRPRAAAARGGAAVGAVAPAAATRPPRRRRRRRARAAVVEHGGASRACDRSVALGVGGGGSRRARLSGRPRRRPRAAARLRRPHAAARRRPR